MLRSRVRGRLFLFRTALGLPLVFGLSHAGMAADETPLWSHVGPWDVRVDPTLNNGCFLLGAYTQGEIIRIGVNNQTRSGYVLLGNEKWKSLETGKEYDLVFAFEGDTPWKVQAKAVQIGASTMLLALFKNSKFLDDFGSKTKLTITWDGNLVSVLPLTGTYAALQALAECQRQFVQTKAPDPFTPERQPNRDPFQEAQ